MILPRSVISLPQAAEQGTLKEVRNNTPAPMTVIYGGETLLELQPRERALFYRHPAGWVVNWEATLHTWIHTDHRSMATALLRARRNGLPGADAARLLAMESSLR